ncbi:MAG: tetratricopeptide repeat protein [Planctomycetota bacterium]|nr:tetratricopeptide repeat protein [Planctomycetota bacterium]
MFIKTPSLLFCLFASVLIACGCENQSPHQPALHSELEMHFLLISDGNTGSARVRLRQFMEVNSESSQPLFLMGLSYHHEKRYVKAVQWFQRSAQFNDPTVRYPPTWHFLGWSQYYLGNAKESKEAFNQYLKMNPNEGDSLFGLGLLAMEEGEFGEASTLFKQSIDVQEDRPKGQAKSKARLADICEQEGNRLLAIQLYEQALSLDPDLYEAWYHLALTLRREGKIEEYQKVMSTFQLTVDRVRPDLKTTRFPE